MAKKKQLFSNYYEYAHVQRTVLEYAPMMPLLYAPLPWRRIKNRIMDAQIISNHVMVIRDFYSAVCVIFYPGKENIFTIIGKYFL